MCEGRRKSLACNVHDKSSGSPRLHWIEKKAQQGVSAGEDLSKVEVPEADNKVDHSRLANGRISCTARWYSWDNGKRERFGSPEVYL